MARVSRRLGYNLYTLKQWTVLNSDLAVRTGTVITHTRYFSAGTASPGLSYVNGACSEPMLGQTIGQLLERAAETKPDKEAFVCPHQGVRCTYEQLLEQSDQLAAGLLALGVRQRDRVAIWSPNSIEWVLVQYATARAGMILVNINPAYRAPEMEFALRKVGVKALFAAERFKSSDYLGMLREVIPELSHDTPGNLRCANLPDMKHVIVLGQAPSSGFESLKDVMAAATPALIGQVRDIGRKLQFDDPVNIQFTSGTTGLPKGATLTHHGIVNNALSVGRNLHYHEMPATICLPVPLYHCFGMVLGSLQAVVHGAKVVLPSAAVEPEANLKAVQEEKCTSLYGTPTMFIDMLNHPRFEQYDTSSLITGIMAGSTCPIELMRQAMTKLHMEHITVCYGTTENSPVTFQSDMYDDPEKRLTTVGKVLAHWEAKVVDENGSITPLGSKGELWTRGTGVMLNYWDDPEKTQEAIRPDRWYKTGDIARIDEDGYCCIVGRMKDMVIRGGENIYPLEVEQYLYQHPKIEDVQVFGVPDERLGELLCAWIKLKEGQSATADDIKNFCKDKMAHFKVPHHIAFVEEYPLTATGKVQKYKLREEAIHLYGLRHLE